MAWTVFLHEDFDAEAKRFSADVRERLVSMIDLLEQFGPHLRRPYCDSLNGSKHANMKELRFDADDDVWRVAFAFDLIRKADRRFDDWLEDES
jgi:hypothetical protein